MALTETKFRLSWIVLSAVFISLSVSAVAELEGHRCYWCGPLAEQVHRSQRASKCNGNKSKTTVCDDGLPYCAIVATSPPYVESRFCVKVYQDECYSVYCNSTKTWKVTCPCNGELCNGVNTKRENVAFETLLKHNVGKLSQTKRLKRGLISKAGFISSRKTNMNNTTTEGNTETQTEAITVVTNEDSGKAESDAISTMDSDNKETITVTETTSLSSESAKAEMIPNESIETAETATTSADSTHVQTKLIEESVTSNPTPVSEITSTMIEVTGGNKDNQISESNIQIDITSGTFDTGDLKTEIILMSSEIPKLANDTKTVDMGTKMTDAVNVQTSISEDKAATSEMKAKTETTTEAVKSAEIEAKLDKSKAKSNEKLPAAEALQHNDTPTTKTTEQMVTSTTPLTIITRFDVSTQATPRNNTAVRIDVHILPIVFGLILQL